VKPHWLRRPETIRKLWIAFVAVLAATVAAEFVVKRHALFGIDGIFGFNAWYGFATCAVMVIVAKLLGYVLKRRDTYYDR
jgi:hypothetical protein